MTHPHAFLELDPTHQHADPAAPDAPAQEEINLLDQPIGWHYEEPCYG